MTKLETDLCVLAERTVANILDEGRKQGHAPDDFLQDADYHIDRAIRHICTSRLIRDGHQLPDAEGVKGHLARALTRITMAINQTP